LYFGLNEKSQELSAIEILRRNKPVDSNHPCRSFRMHSEKDRKKVDGFFVD